MAQLGRNKAQFEPRVFQIVRTEHFDVYSVTGTAWDREPGQDLVLYREPLTSFGASLRMNLFFAILRVDNTVPHDRGRAFNDRMWTVAFGEMFRSTGTTTFLATRFAAPHVGDRR